MFDELKEVKYFKKKEISKNFCKIFKEIKRLRVFKKQRRI